MKNKTFGYMLGSDYLIVLEKAVLIPLGAKKNAPIHIRPTMFRLLIYLIENASVKPILDDDIMRDVWEKYDLRASKARLWQVMNAMCKKLLLKESFSEIFVRVENTGYLVNENQVRAIYTNEQCIETGASYATERSLSGYSHHRG
ncbi:hypothetical protein [Enterobacter sp. MGH 16]|uniref:hypothetical protein n=1 Tax=Enterobacter cloacae complex TaxID=354276 RepID=UPI0003BE198F|nr:hypothetical protein [Enterobacter sp. MGH 16]ESN53163.1 hypothetical protein L362_00060 [Enterobacter sp. MGH 16]